MLRLIPLALLLAAVPFAAIGIAFLVAPHELAGRVGIELTTATAIADVRAVYGGMQVACAIALVGASRVRSWWRAGLALQSALYGGLFLARWVSYPASGWPDALGWALHGGEAVGCAIGLGLLWRIRREPFE